jgi:tRNA pseudouridine55 synthase
MSAATPKPRRFDRDVDGILLLDKPLGMSSNAALQRTRVLFRALKAGHAGSLDPLASGMLPVCLGQATKVCAFLLDARKTYRFSAKLGERTDTGDSEGEVIEQRPVPALSVSEVAVALQSFRGAQTQVPPMYSALKVDGERLYAKARRGEIIERKARAIEVESIELIQFERDRIDVEVRCSKGTYVRTLAEDIAISLGTLAHLVALRRLEVDPFGTGPMYTIDFLERLEGREALESLLIPPDQALLHLPACTFDSTGELALLRGQAAPSLNAASTGDQVRIYGPEGRFLGLGEATPDGAVQPRRLLVKSTINP